MVIEVVRHDPGCKPSKASKKKSLDYTVHVEWDGGGVEEIRNPEWRMKGDEPDKQGRISHRDARVRLQFLSYCHVIISIILLTLVPYIWLFYKSAPAILQILGQQTQFHKRS